MAKTILFVSHDASRTGAPLSLLHLLEWLAERSDWRMNVLLGDAGELRARFEALAPTFVCDAARRKRTRAQRVAARLERSVRRSPLDRWLSGLARQGVDAVYSASAATATLLPLIRRRLGAPIVLHVRELEYVLSRHVKTGTFRAAQPHVAHYLADSKATRRNLIDRHGVKAEAVTLVYESIPAHRYRAEASRFRATEVRTSLGIPADAYVAASCGTIHWRKGPDLFLQVARALIKRLKRPIVILWIGGPTRGEEYERFRYDVEHFGLADHVRVSGIVEDPMPLLAAADVFLLTSREEPLGIAALEAAVLERPVVCFSGAGGMAELVGDGRGFTVPYGDTDAMAEVASRLESDPALAATTARRFAEYVIAHHDIDVVAAQTKAAIEKQLVHERP